ncbi:hypothetical protein MMC29_001423 [Sticta canariensis]|nr:hypothetical protein [Sticta canariensis]
MFREYAIDIEAEDEMEGDWDEQTVILLNATTFGAVYLARAKQPPQRYAAMYVPAAANWILLAGQRIYELCKSDYNRKDGAPGLSLDEIEWLWDKGRGYSLGRWALWKKRFGEVAITQGLQDGVRDLDASTQLRTVQIRLRKRK